MSLLSVIFVDVTILLVCAGVYYFWPRQVGVVLVKGQRRKPSKGTKHATCFDLHARQTVTISPGTVEEVPTGVILNLPRYIDAHLHPRSSYRKRGISMLGTGIIDSDFRGELTMLLFNHSDIPFTVEVDERCGQVEFTRVLNIAIRLDGVVTQTGRGEGRFGSTGK